MENSFLTPAETSTALITVGVTKAKLPISKMVVLGILAGAYIAFGAHLCTTVTTGITDMVGFGLTKFIGGAVFSVGLMLVVIAGAELFTGNSLMIMALLDRKITPAGLLKNWLIVYFANLIGAILVAWLIYASGLNGSGTALTAIGKTAVSTAQAKAAIPLLQLFIRAVLANWLVCLAVTLATASRDIISKILACFFPIMAFVAMGFEHSIANMYFLPAGLLAAHGTVAALTPIAALGNIVMATLGNIVGGSVFVGLAYWFSYQKRS